MSPIPMLRFIFSLFAAGLIYYPFSNVMTVNIIPLFPVAAASDYGVFILMLWHGMPIFVLFACIYYLIIAVQKRVGIDT